MSKNYTQYDWASDRLARLNWLDAEEGLIAGIDKRMARSSKKNRKVRRVER